MRGFALLLGVVFHAAQSFGPHNNYWAIVDSTPSTFLERFCFGSHSFRMALFFLIAGFFARLLLSRRGTAGYVRNRLQRILVPLVVGWVVLYPLVVYLWLWGASVALAARCDRWFGRLCHWPAAILVFVLLCVPMLLTMRGWIVDTPSLPCFPTRRRPFSMAFASWSDGSCIANPAGGCLRAALAVALGSWCGPVCVAERQRWTPSLFWLSSKHIHSVLLAFTACYTVVMWGFVLGFLGLFTRFCDGPTPGDVTWRMPPTGSTWSICRWLSPCRSWSRARTCRGRSSFLSSILAAAIAFLLLSYHSLVRSSWIGLLLNGHRYPRRKPGLVTEPTPKWRRRPPTCGTGEGRYYPENSEKPASLI